MAAIEGKIPSPHAEKAAAGRVVVKVRPEIRAAGAGAEELAERAGGEWASLTRTFPGVRLQPYFGAEAGHLVRDLQSRARSAAGREKAARLASYLSIECPAGADPEAIARVVASWPGVESAYVEGGPTPPPVNPSDDPRSASQGYLDAAPQGIDARWAWSGGGTDGSGVGIVDVEQGWVLDHEDLVAANITLISGVNNRFHGHGTAVLGELTSNDNAKGGIGIAPNAKVRVVSQWRTASAYSTAQAILSAAAAMASGDVMLLEAQTIHPNATGYVPVEVEDAVFDAIDYATSEGIVVVEAGGNGSVDLDAFQNGANKHILRRDHPDFRDSGAILVGAASSAAPHSRLSFSNFGSRIDCYAWGEHIDTTGDGWNGTSTSGYTTGFGGTSGASPIVTGAAALLQAWRAAAAQPPYTPGALRALLSSSTLNTPSATPSTDRIGVMPNLRKIIESERLARIDLGRWAAVVRILFGVVNDGGGIVIGPGGIPIPVDPWGPWRLSEEKRDVLAALAASEIASLISNRSERRRVERAALGAINAAVKKMAGGLE